MSFKYEACPIKKKNCDIQLIYNEHNKDINRRGMDYRTPCV